ncbi:MAG: Rieske 2Fe-2S domain-containing protein [bacterium]
MEREGAVHDEREATAPDVLRFFHPVLPSAHLRRKPVSVSVAGRRYVLFRDATGCAAALDDACPHRRAPLSLGTVRPDGRLACAYHGWHFDALGHGVSPSCPELRHCDARSYQVIEKYDYLWLAHRSTPPAAMPTFTDDAFRFAGTISARFDAPLELALDNISEDEHFAFIHSTFGWNEHGASAVEMETTNHVDHSHVRLEGLQRPSLLAPLGGVRSGDRFHNEWVTRFQPVHSVYTFWWIDPISAARRPITTRAVVFLVPETMTTTQAHMFLFLSIGPSMQRLIQPVSHWLARRVARMELLRDARFVAHLADAPTTLRGMRLTRFDKALIHNRKLLRTLYWEAGQPDAMPSSPVRHATGRSAGVTP